MKYELISTGKWMPENMCKKCIPCPIKIGIGENKTRCKVCGTKMVITLFAGGGGSSKGRHENEKKQ